MLENVRRTKSGEAKTAHFWIPNENCILLDTMDSRCDSYFVYIIIN